MSNPARAQRSLMKNLILLHVRVYAVPVLGSVKTYASAPVRCPFNFSSNSYRVSDIAILRGSLFPPLRLLVQSVTVL